VIIFWKTEQNTSSGNILSEALFYLIFNPNTGFGLNTTKIIRKILENENRYIQHLRVLWTRLELGKKSKSGGNFPSFFPKLRSVQI
jgi:hypothetical protein